jgi:hypothetical protein
MKLDRNDRKLTEFNASLTAYNEDKKKFGTKKRSKQYPDEDPENGESDLRDHINFENQSQSDRERKGLLSNDDGIMSEESS